MPPTDRTRLLYFCDETSQHDHHMAVGGLAINLDAAKAIMADILAINRAYGITSEVKWATAKARRNNAHVAYIDLLFTLIEGGMAHFHIRFQPTDEYDHSVSGARKRIDTVSKAHYQLLLHRAVRYYGGTCDIHIRPDDGECTALIPVLWVRLTEVEWINTIIYLGA